MNNATLQINDGNALMPTLKVAVNRSAESGLCELALLQASALVTARRERLMVVGNRQIQCITRNANV